jgi:predicted ATP-dependent Lon-type protease
MENTDKSAEEKRKDMAKESWIKNVMRVIGINREQAEAYYQRIQSNAEAIIANLKETS